MTWLRISSFRWEWPGPTGMQHDECHAVMDEKGEVIALCPDKEVAQRVLTQETLIRSGTVGDIIGLKTSAQKLRDDALSRLNGREHLS